MNYISPTTAPITTSEYQVRCSQNIELYEGRAYNVFESNTQDIREPKLQEALYLQKNLFRMITDTFTLLSVFENPEISSETNQEPLDEWVLENDFYDFIQEAFKRASICGDAIAILYQDEAGEWKPQLINNQIWEPHFKTYDTGKEALVNDLCYKFKLAGNEEKEYTVKKRFAYNPADNTTVVSFIVNQAGSDEALSFGQIPDEIREAFGMQNEADNSTEQTVDRKLFFRFKNEKSMRDYFGLSDYTDNVRAVVDNINRLLELSFFVQVLTGNPQQTVPAWLVESAIQKAGEITEILKKHNADEAVVNQWSNLSEVNTISNTKFQQFYTKQELIKGLKFIPTREGESKPEFIQPTSTIPQIETSIDRYKQEIYEDLALPIVLIDADFKVGNLSGVALQRMLTRTLHKKNGKEKRIKKFLLKIIQNAFDPQNKTDVNINFKDGVIDNIMDEIQKVEKMLELRLMSRIDALKDVFGLTETEAQQRLMQIDQENNLDPEIPPQPQSEENLPF